MPPEGSLLRRLVDALGRGRRKQQALPQEGQLVDEFPNEKEIAVAILANILAPEEFAKLSDADIAKLTAAINTKLGLTITVPTEIAEQVKKVHAAMVVAPRADKKP
jgi:hypothetical protein